jgi:hypothetical protein
MFVQTDSWWFGVCFSGSVHVAEAKAEAKAVDTGSNDASFRLALIILESMEII